MSAGFTLKATPKPVEQAGFKNFYNWENAPTLDKQKLIKYGILKENEETS